MGMVTRIVVEWTMQDIVTLFVLFFWSLSSDGLAVDSIERKRESFLVATRNISSGYESGIAQLAPQ
jgi:hypothetical protein